MNKTTALLALPVVFAGACAHHSNVAPPARYEEAGASEDELDELLDPLFLFSESFQIVLDDRDSGFASLRVGAGSDTASGHEWPANFSLPGFAADACFVNRIPSRQVAETDIYMYLCGASLPAGADGDLSFQTIVDAVKFSVPTGWVSREELAPHRTRLVSFTAPDSKIASPGMPDADVQRVPVDATRDTVMVLVYSTVSRPAS